MNLPGLGPADWQAVRLTAALAAVTTGLLMVLGTPLAWWLARTASRWRGPVSALVATPLVLPPTVMGFYLLVLMGPQGAIGRLTEVLGLGGLAFTFSGLVLASAIYSLPFVVQPLQQAFGAIDPKLLDAASSLRAGALDRFFSVALPLARPGVLTAVVLGFAHTVGEFGIVLMVGGNIEGRTRTLSVLLYDHVEAGDLPQAHALAGLLLVFSLAMLLALQALAGPRRDRP